MQAAAAIDVGSNATRLVIEEVSSTGICTRNLHERYALRLGADVFAQGHIGAAKQKALADVFVDIAAKLQAHGVRTYRAVGTAAMRDANNGKAVCQGVFAASGLSLQVISGLAESKLMRQALLRAVGGAEPDTLLMDLGGGSLEIERAGGSGKRGRSLPLGSVRLLESLPMLRNSLDAAALAQAEAHVMSLLRQHVSGPRRSAWAVGTGGNLDALAKILPAPRGRLPMVDVGAPLASFTRKVAGLSLAARTEQFGLRPDRADLIVPALLIVQALTKHFGIEHLVVPGAGLRDALLYQLFLPTDPGVATRRLLGQGSDAANTAIACQKLSHELFDDLSSAHGFRPNALHLLDTALFAWYFGAFLQPRAAAKHGLYIVESLENLELDRRGTQVVRFILASLLKAPQEPLPAFEGEAADAQVGQTLAGLLRVAIAMAPQGRRTSALRVDLLQEPIVIEADLSAPLSPALLSPLGQALGRQIVVR